MNDSNEAEFGDEPIELVKLSGEDEFDCLISAGYFTCSFQIKVTGSEKHKISLVRRRFCQTIPKTPTTRCSNCATNPTTWDRTLP